MKNFIFFALLILCSVAYGQKKPKNDALMLASEKSVFAPLPGEFSVAGRDPINYWVDTAGQVYSRQDFNECPVFLDKKSECIYATRVIKLSIDTTRHMAIFVSLYYQVYQSEGSIALGNGMTFTKISSDYEIEQIGEHVYRLLMKFPEGDEEFMIDRQSIMNFVPKNRRRLDADAQTIDYRTYAGQNNLFLPIITKL